MYWDRSDIPRHYRRKWQEEEQACRLYEEPGCFGLSAASCVDLTDHTPEKWVREVDRMEAEDTSTFDDDGRVW